jgi:hypothetical protein
MTRDFRKRPTARAALDHWYKVRDSIPIASARWPLRKPDESVGEVVVNTLTAAREGVHNLRYLFEEVGPLLDVFVSVKLNFIRTRERGPVPECQGVMTYGARRTRCAPIL